MPWLNDLAQEAEPKRYRLSADLEPALKDLQKGNVARGILKSSRKFARKKLRSASIQKKLAALLYRIKEGRPAWELRWAIRSVSFQNGVRDVTIVYEVNHLEEQIVVSLWYGLPES